jgi:hypothetical protein
MSMKINTTLQNATLLVFGESTEWGAKWETEVSDPKQYSKALILKDGKL